MDRNKMMMGLSIIWFMAGFGCLLKGDYLFTAVAIAVGGVFLYKSTKTK